MAKRTNQSEGAQFVRFFGPILDALRSLGDSATPGEVVEHIASALAIPEETLNEVTPSGALRFPNRVAWARFYLYREGLIGSSRRGIWNLTEKGKTTHLSQEDANAMFQKWSRTFAEERKRGKVDQPAAGEHPPDDDVVTGLGYRDQLLAILRDLPPDGFERLSQRLLREAGFVQVFVTGRSGDGGIDGYGTLQVNPLVSFKVLFQCKRYRDAVSSPHVRDFRGAMQGRADKGIIITTGTFTADAQKEANRDGVPPIELVDGSKLVDLFSNLQLGLKPVNTFEIDSDFFTVFREKL
jgi:restriction system protein